MSGLEIGLAGHPRPARIDPTPTRIAGDLIDGSMVAWRHQQPFYGDLTTRWTGQPKSTQKRLNLLLHHMDCLLMRMNPHWSCELQTCPLDGDPTGVLVTGFDRPTTVIPIELDGRSIRIDGHLVGLALPDAGRRILERAADAIGAALGRRVGRRS